jgi:thiamine-phosphate pyrophosphorylase
MLKCSQRNEIGVVMKSIDRIIDSNFNRLAEGLRFLEDVARMLLADQALTQQLKTLRHELIRSDLPFNLDLLKARDAEGDVGENLTVNGDPLNKDLPLLVVANSRRAQESLRVLEEMAKLPDYRRQLEADKFKMARFRVYSLEQRLVFQLTRRDKAQKIRGLYVILDTAAIQDRDPLEVAQKLVGARINVLQLRDKKMGKAALIGLADSLQKLCARNDILFVVNDYLDVALAVEADGLHVGQDDLPLEVARRLLPPDKILGASAYTPEAARRADEAGADYLAVGSIYPTPSKEDIEVVGLERIAQIKQVSKLPLVAIGGITSNNAGQVLAAGGDCLCVISAVLNTADIASAARQMLEIVEARK